MNPLLFDLIKECSLVVFLCAVVMWIGSFIWEWVGYFYRSKNTKWSDEDEK